jgi:hypothetical protein
VPYTIIDQRTNLLLLGPHGGKIINGESFKSGDGLDGFLKLTPRLSTFGRLDRRSEFWIPRVE